MQDGILDAAEKPNALVVVGPTASGKSALAVDLARALNGVVINADSMQLYADLSVLTARPTEAEMAGIPHRLYGVLDGAENCSAQRWREMAEAEARAALNDGRTPILCGGTGFYLKALLEGLSPIPDIPKNVRGTIRAEIAGRGPVATWEILQRVDPTAARRIEPTDSQRLARALEVYRATGRTLTDWHGEPLSGPPHGFRAAVLCLNPPRDTLRARCDIRFDRMLEAGALDEVARLVERNLPAHCPITKAVGVPELSAHLEGRLDLDEAAAQAKTATRRYAKRQQTWLKSQIVANYSINTQYSEKIIGDFLSFIREYGLIHP